MLLLKKSNSIQNDYIDEDVFKNDDLNLMLKNKAFLNKPCVEIKNVFYTPLQASIIYQSSKIRNFLLNQRTIDINAQNFKGENALITAITSKSPTSIIKELFRKNIEICIPKGSTKTSILDYADPSWEGYSVLNHMVQRKRSYCFNYKKQNSINQAEVKLKEKCEDNTIFLNQEQMFTNKDKVIDKEKEIYTEFNRNNSKLFSRNNNSLTHKKISKFLLKDSVFEIPQQKNMLRSNSNLIDNSEIIFRNKCSVENNSEQNDIISTDKVHINEFKVDNYKDVLKKNNQEKVKDSGIVKDINTNLYFNSALDQNSRFKTSRSNLLKEQKLKEVKNKKFNSSELNHNCFNNTIEYFDLQKSVKNKHQSEFQTKVNNEEYDHYEDLNTEDDYLLLINHQITESIEMSKYLFSCGFCSGSRPWK